MQSFQPNSFITAMFISTIDFCHFVPLSVALILASGHKLSRKQNLSAYFFPHIPTEWDEIWCGDKTVYMKHIGTTFEGGFLLFC